MNKFIKGIFACMIFVSMFSCVTIKAVKRGGEIEEKGAYVALMFANKSDLLSVGKKYVYIILKQAESGRQYFIPFSSGNELRLISLAPGNYSIDDFVYLDGIGSVSIGGPSSPGVIDGKPEYANTTWTRASFPDDYRKDFTVDVGEIVFLGNFSWEWEFAIFDSGVMVKRIARPQEDVLSDIRNLYPSLPESMKLISLSE